jgi:hypothetical protein
MSVFNRRNAVVGWATMTVFKTWLSRRGKSDQEAAARAAAEEEAAKRWWRRGASGEPPPPPPEPKKKRKKGRAIGLLMATAVGVAVWLGSRRSKSAPQPWGAPADPPPAPPAPPPTPVADEGDPVE